MQNLREQQGTWLPVEDRGVQTGDQLIADVHIKLDGNVVAHMHDAQFLARRVRLSGILIEDLDTQVSAGLRPGEKSEFTAHTTNTHPDEKIRDKDVQIEIALKEIKKLELAEINQQFLDSLGFTNEQELREALGEQMKSRIEYGVQQSMRDQITNYLLQEVKIELPETLSERQAERVISRRALDMLMRGVPQSTVDDRMEELRSGAKQDAVKELKLYFIMQKVASMLKVDVSEAELNGRIALIAAQSGSCLGKGQAGDGRRQYPAQHVRPDARAEGARSHHHDGRDRGSRSRPGARDQRGISKSLQFFARADHGTDTSTQRHG